MRQPCRGCRASTGRTNPLRNEIGQNLSGVNAGIDGGVHALDRTRLIDQVTDPIGKARADISTRTIRQPYAPSRVTQERVRKAEFFRKSGVFLNRIEADSQNLNIL